MKVRQTLLVCPFKKIGLDELIKGENADYVVNTLRKLIEHKRNIVVFGTIGSGASTFAKALYQEIPYDESIVCLSTEEFGKRVSEAGRDYLYVVATRDGAELANLVTADYARWITNVLSDDIDETLCELKREIGADFEKCVADNLDILIEVGVDKDGQRFIIVNEMRRNFDGEVIWYAPIISWNDTLKKYDV